MNTKLTFSCILLTTLLSHPVYAQDCSAIRDNTQRLDCYDRISKGGKQPAGQGTWPSELTEGAPSRLLGRWGSGPWQCAGAHREGGYENLWSIHKNEYSICGGAMCIGKFTYHRQMSNDTFRLDSEAGLDRTKSKYIIKFVDENIIETKNSYDNFSKTETYVRCNKNHARRSIGFSNQDMYGRDQSSQKTFEDIIYSVKYISFAAKKCSEYVLDEKIYKLRLNAAAMAEYKVFEERRNRGGSYVDRSLSLTDFISTVRVNYAEERSSNDIEYDYKTLGQKTFCDELYEAYGPNGRIIPNVIEDKKRRKI